MDIVCDWSLIDGCGVWNLGILLVLDIYLGMYLDYLPGYLPGLHIWLPSWTRQDRKYQTRDFGKDDVNDMATWQVLAHRLHGLY